MRYVNKLEPIAKPLPLLADFPEYVEPMRCERRYLAPPVVDEKDGRLLVRSWRYWYNARGIVEMENRLDAKATAIVMVHPWGVDDGHGLRTPEPAGCVDFCTVEKNHFSHKHIQDVVNPFLRRMRPHVARIGFSLTGKEDGIRALLYPSIDVTLDKVNAEKGEKLLRQILDRETFRGEPLVSELSLNEKTTVKSYFEQIPAIDAGERCNGKGFWELPMPLVKGLNRGPDDVVFYDADGYPKVRDYLKGLGVRHILMIGYCADMCVIRSPCGYDNLSKDFNLFLVGDATLATFPGSTTPRFATQVVLANAALTQMLTQVNWVKIG